MILKRKVRGNVRERRSRWLLAAALLSLSGLDGAFALAEPGMGGFPSSEGIVPLQSFEPVPEIPGLPTRGQEFTAKTLLRSLPGAWERSRERPSDHGSTRDLRCPQTATPGFASKLDSCSEFTKPNSLVIRSMGTPKNHRSPPC